MKNKFIVKQICGKCCASAEKRLLLPSHAHPLSLTVNGNKNRTRRTVVFFFTQIQFTWKRNLQMTTIKRTESITMAEGKKGEEEGGGRDGRGSISGEECLNSKFGFCDGIPLILPRYGYDVMRCRHTRSEKRRYGGTSRCERGEGW